MFQRYLLLLLIGATHPLWAQITYQSSDVAAIGDTFVLSRALPTPGLGLGADGSGITWDASTLAPTSQRVSRFVDPDQAGYRFTWIANCIFLGGNPFSCPNDWDALTNLGEESLGQSSALFDALPINFSDRTRHYDVQSDYLREVLLGLSIGTTIPIPLIVEFTQPDTLLHFPVALGNADSSHAAYDIDYTDLGFPFASFTRLRRVQEVTGEGTLITPFGTYSQVLKIEQRIERRDSIRFSADSALVINQTEVEYAWYDPAYGRAVMTASGNLIAGLPVLTEVEYLDTLRCIEPTAFFLALPNPITFDNTTNTATVNFISLSQSVDSSFWTFGDGGLAVANNPSHTYTQPGVYSAQLIGCNTNCSPVLCDTFTLPVIVTDSTQAAAFFTADPDEGCVGEVITFNNNSFNANSYEWDFDDGTTSTLEDPTHTYNQAGTYEVQLVAINGANRDTLTRTVTIQVAPTVMLGPDVTISQGQSTTLQSTITGGPVDYFWTPGQGLSCTTCPDPVAQPATTNTYTLTVRNACSQANASTTVEVTNIVGLTDLNSLGLAVYPNPTQDRVTVHVSDVPVSRWRLLDPVGREIRHGREEAQRFDIDLQALPVGVYWLAIEAAGRQVHLTVKVQR